MGLLRRQCWDLRHRVNGLKDDIVRMPSEEDARLVGVRQVKDSDGRGSTEDRLNP